MTPEQLESTRNVVRTGSRVYLGDVRALLDHIDHLTADLDAAERQIAARTGETAAERLWRTRAEEAEATIERVRELIGYGYSVTRDPDDGGGIAIVIEETALEEALEGPTE